MPEGERLAPTALVVAGDEEIRVLLRGLLRLHHFRVLGEARGVAEAVGLLEGAPPSVVVADTELADGSPAALLQELKRVSPGVRSVIVSADGAEGSSGLGEERPDALLRRPFRVRDFAVAIGAVPADPSPAR